MLPKAKTLLLALLLAYRALAVPMDNGQQDEVQSVIDALKGQISKHNISVPSSMVDNIEHTLKCNGVLSAEHIQTLDSKIQDAMSSTKDLNIGVIANETIDYLVKHGAFNESTLIKEKTVSITTDLINRVLSQGGEAVKDCPGGGRLCGGCVIL